MNHDLHLKKPPGRINPANLVGVLAGVIGAGLAVTTHMAPPDQEMIAGYVLAAGPVRELAERIVILRPGDEIDITTLDKRFTRIRDINAKLMSALFRYAGALAAGVGTALWGAHYHIANHDSLGAVAGAGLIGFLIAGCLGYKAGEIISYPARWLTLGVVSAPVAAIDALRMAARLIIGKDPVSGRRPLSGRPRAQAPRVEI